MTGLSETNRRTARGCVLFCSVSEELIEDFLAPIPARPNAIEPKDRSLVAALCQGLPLVRWRFAALACSLAWLEDCFRQGGAMVDALQGEPA